MKKSFGYYMYVVVNRNKEGNHWMPFLGSFRHDKKSVSCRKRTKMCQCINHVAHFCQCKHDIFIQCCSIISMSYACANAEKSFPGGGEGGVWRFSDIISFWCRATDLHLLKRELNFAIKILRTAIDWGPTRWFFLVLMANSCSILDFDNTWKTSHT